MSNDLSSFFEDSKLEIVDDTYLCSLDSFEAILFNIQSTLGYIWLLDIIAVDEREYSGKFGIIYHFVCVEKYEKFSLKLELPEHIKLKSIAHMWMNAQIYEQEAYEKFGIEFSRSYTKKFFKDDENIFPLRKNCTTRPSIKLDDSNYDLQLTLKNPFLNKSIFFNTNLTENKISNCRIEPGFFHLGLEKAIENMDFKNTFLTLEDSFSSSGVMWSFLLADNIEKSKNINIPERAKALRMVFLEISRVAEHFRFINLLSADLQVQSVYENSLLWLTRVQALMISFSGNENIHNTITPGGVLKDTSQVWISRVGDEIFALEKSLLSEYSLIKNSPNWKMSLNLAIGSKELATSWCSSGPIARALGINLDFRKLNPFYFYKDVNFDVPVGTNGTAFDLLIVKIEEIFQSFKIIVQVLDNLPTGAVIAESVDHFSQFKTNFNLSEVNEEIYRKSINNFNQFTDINSSSFFEGHNGIVGLSVLQRNEKILRIKMTSPATINKALFEKVIVGKEVSSLTNLWCALDINMTEVER
jgi:NADH:ubiquinone oxidoreductase subunit D/NADH:ubiquinone oxidoreductase subunit C